MKNYKHVVSILYLRLIENGKSMRFLWEKATG